MTFFSRFRFRGGNDSNMAVMEVTLPSGYTVDNDALPSLRLSNNIKRVETKDGDSVVMLYFDKVYIRKRTVRGQAREIVTYMYSKTSVDGSLCVTVIYLVPSSVMKKIL